MTYSTFLLLRMLDMKDHVGFEHWNFNFNVLETKVQELSEQMTTLTPVLSDSDLNKIASNLVVTSAMLTEIAQGISLNTAQLQVVSSYLTSEQLEIMASTFSLTDTQIQSLVGNFTTEQWKTLAVSFTDSQLSSIASKLQLTEKELQQLSGTFTEEQLKLIADSLELDVELTEAQLLILAENLSSVQISSISSALSREQLQTVAGFLSLSGEDLSALVESLTSDQLKYIASSVDLSQTQLEELAENLTVEQISTIAAAVSFTEEQISAMAMAITWTEEQLTVMASKLTEAHLATISEKLSASQLEKMTAILSEVQLKVVAQGLSDPQLATVGKSLEDAQLEKIAEGLTEPQLEIVGKGFSLTNEQIKEFFGDIDLTEEQLASISATFTEEQLKRLAEVLSSEQLSLLASFLTEEQLNVVGEKLTLTDAQIATFLGAVELTEAQLATILDSASAETLAKIAAYFNLSEEQIVALKGADGKSFTFEDLTEAQLALLKGADGANGLSVVSIKADETSFKLIFTMSNGTVLESGFPEIAKGAAGDSAYESAVKQGFAGTVDFWLASHKMVWSDLSDADKNEISLTWSKLTAEEKTEILADFALNLEGLSEDESVIITSFAAALTEKQAKTTSLSEISTLKDSAMIPIEQDGENAKISALTLLAKLQELSPLAIYSGDLNAYTWEELSYFGSLGIAQNLFEVGATKTIKYNNGANSYNAILVDFKKDLVDVDTRVRAPMSFVTDMVTLPIDLPLWDTEIKESTTQAEFFAGDWLLLRHNSYVNSEENMFIPDDLRACIAPMYKSVNNIGWQAPALNGGLFKLNVAIVSIAEVQYSNINVAPDQTTGVVEHFAYSYFSSDERRATGVQYLSRSHIESGIYNRPYFFIFNGEYISDSYINIHSTVSSPVYYNCRMNFCI